MPFCSILKKDKDLKLTQKTRTFTRKDTSNTNIVYFIIKTKLPPCVLVLKESLWKLHHSFFSVHCSHSKQISQPTPIEIESQILSGNYIPIIMH